jgi:hypothetical protein
MTVLLVLVVILAAVIGAVGASLIWTGCIVRGLGRDPLETVRMVFGNVSQLRGTTLRFTREGQVERVSELPARVVAESPDGVVDELVPDGRYDRIVIALPSASHAVFFFPQEMPDGDLEAVTAELVALANVLRASRAGPPLP